MTRLTFRSSLALCAIVASTAVPSAAAEPEDWMYCNSDGSQSPVYLSGLFELPAGTTRDAAAQAYGAFLRGEYDYEGGTPVCSATGTRTAASLAMRTTQTDLASKKVIATGWEYRVSKAAAPSAAPTAASAKPSAAPTIDPNDPRLAVFSATDRVTVANELKSSYGYCGQNAMYWGPLDCACFARLVLEHRIAHPEQRMGTIDGGFVPVPSLLAGLQGGLDGGKCLDEEKTRRWSSERTHGDLFGAIRANKLTEAEVEQIARCRADELIKAFRADSHLQNLHNEDLKALETCQTRLSH